MSTIAPFGDRAVLITCDDRDERLQVGDTLASALPAVDVRIGVRSVLVVVDEPVRDLELDVRRALTISGAESRDTQAQAEPVIVDVRYDGVDLEDVATRLGMSPDGVVAAHIAQGWVVDVMGFAPGFGYLIPAGAATADWARLARRDSPRTQVPAGSVALAAGMSAVYPAQMPGGWNLVGRTSMTMFEASNPARPSVLMPGARVQFVSVSP